MAKVGNRVKETTTTTGTGTLDLLGAPTGFRAFLTEFVTTDRVSYLIVDDPDNPTDYEVGIGTITSGSPNTLSRDIVEASSNSEAKVSWSAGTKTVIATPSAALLDTAVKAKTANYTVLLDDFNDVITGDSSAISPATLTVTLPTVASARVGFRLTVKNIGSSGTVIVDGNGAETIDGDATKTLSLQYDTIVLICDGSNWLSVTPNVQDLEVIANGTVSNAASLDIINLSADYRAYKLVFSNLLPVTDAANLEVRTDTNNGASFEAGASDYAWIFIAGNATATVGATGDNADDALRVTGGLSDTAGEEGHGHVMIVDPMNSGVPTGIISHISARNSSGNESTWAGGGRRLADEANNAIQFIFTTGNISTMTYTLYGLRAS